MSSPAWAPAPDQAERDAAVRERARNVLIDAGAGTGKTAILVDRLVEMVAPTAGNAAVSIARIAAITFTRKAAGELRLRIRERLLEELARRDPTPARDGQLREAVGGLDTAHVGTIHSFADRLLRLRPVEADLSPTYEIAEDTDALVAETVDVLPAERLCRPGRRDGRTARGDRLQDRCAASGVRRAKVPGVRGPGACLWRLARRGRRRPRPCDSHRPSLQRRRQHPLGRTGSTPEDGTRPAHRSALCAVHLPSFQGTYPRAHRHSRSRDLR